MKKELLAPAGNRECLRAAVCNGADAVYLAGKNFGARKFANNFSDDELLEAVAYAHLYGVKIYVTVNTIIYEQEIEECLNYIAYLDSIGVDAIIVQDLGLIKLVREFIPELEIHASTQAHTHNMEQIKLLESLGVKRVVLARELSLDEINKLDTNMELEIFIHGALCISYSGQCLFSSGVLYRSGNRGECAGLCRIPYNLVKDGSVVLNNKYLISPKEFNSTSYIEEIKKSQAFSLKIEGRMKSPEYVGYVTKIYRKLLDNDNYVLSEEEIFNLKSLYNRGFTKGYLNGTSDQDLISLNSSNHLGVKIGEVIGFTKDKIKVLLSHELRQGDAIRLPDDKGAYVNFLYNEKEMLISKGKIGEVVFLDNRVELKHKGEVMMTVNSALIEELRNTLEPRIPVVVRVKAIMGEELIVSYSDYTNTVEFKGDKVEMARSMPLLRTRIKEIMGKLGNTPFILEKIDIVMDDNIFIPVGVLNQIRRNLVEALIYKRTTTNKMVKRINYNKTCCRRNVNQIKISALARNEEQVQALLEENVDMIYVTNQELYNKYKSDKVYFRLSRVNSNYEDFKNENLLIGETGSLKYRHLNNIVSDYYLNVVNSSYANYLDSLGVKRVTLSPELNIEQIRDIVFRSSVEVEVLGYGTLEYMIMKYNLQKNMNLDDGSYMLQDKSKRLYPIISDKYTHVMSDKKINLICSIKELEEMGVNYFRLELFLEKKEEIKEIFRKLKTQD